MPVGSGIGCPSETWRPYRFLRIGRRNAGRSLDADWFADADVHGLRARRPGAEKCEGGGRVESQRTMRMHNTAQLQ